LIACILDGGFGREPVPERIALFDTRTGKLLRRWNDSGKPSRDYERMAFSPDGQLLASSDGFDVHLWETATGREIRAFRGHRGEFISLTFSGDSRRLASTSWDSTVLIWDLAGPPTSENLEKCWTDLAGAEGTGQRSIHSSGESDDGTPETRRVGRAGSATNSCRQTDAGTASPH
jgi:WD40 repeat protein